MMTTPQIVADIISTGMGIDQSAAWVYDQRREIPKDNGIYVTVAVIGAVPYGNNRRYVGQVNALEEHLSTHLQETVSVSLFSRDISVMHQYPRALNAIVNGYAIQKQDEYGMRIGSIPMSMVDTSYQDGGSMVYRMTMTLRVLRAYTADPVEVDYYDQFSSELTTEE